MVNDLTRDLIAVVIAALALSASCTLPWLENERRPFTTDFCSASPDVVAGVDLKLICLEHDHPYWRGGTRAERLAADRLLRKRIEEAGLPLYARLVYVAVRIGGMPCTGLPWRWGYGYTSWCKWYTKENPREHEEANDQPGANARQRHGR